MLEKFFPLRICLIVLVKAEKMLRLVRIKILAIIAITVVASSGIIIIGQLPVHRTNNQNSDIEGDVTDSNIDIVLIKSYLEGDYIALQMKVIMLINTEMHEQ